MLTILNNYAHGYVTIPVIIACKKQGLFEILDTNNPVPFTTLVHRLQANSGHLRIALHTLESLNWVSKNSSDEYVLTAEAEIHQKIPQDIMDLMSFPMQDYVNQAKKKHSLKKWMKLSGKSWNIDNPMYSQFLDGMLIIPLLLTLKEYEQLGNSDNPEVPLLSKLSPAVREEIIAFFINQGWLTQQQGVDRFTDIGRFIMDRIFITATVASYRPMLSKMSGLIFGDCKSVFERDLLDHELHVDRTLNVIGSGFQHEKYFSDMEEIILSIFNREPIDEQPRYVADMGCGDGKLLEKIYAIIKNKSLRGKALDEHPIKLIGIDFNEKALKETAKTLINIDHVVLKGDINDPEQMIVDIKNRGIHDVENILHVRSFLDHDRPYIPPSNISATEARSKIPSEAVYVDRAGKSIPATSVMQSLVEHLERWSFIIGKHGLIVLEVHCLEPKTVNDFIDKCENLHFDAYHRFSQQQLVEADKFLMAAAEIGLFPDKNTCKKYPKTLPFGRITLNHFTPREYRVRFAREADLPALQLIENQSWEPGLQTPLAVLKERLKKYPEGQLVLELDNQVVGAVYSQRIANKDDLKDHSIETVESLHSREGSIIQLLGVNILPEMQHRNLGDQLLEFMLQRCSLMNGIQSVVGITRCKEFHNSTSTDIQEYITIRNVQGRLVDTTLRFHEVHGAKILEPVPNYRPHDKKNNGYGVLLEYDIFNRKRSDIQLNSKNSKKIAKVDDTEKLNSIKHFIENTITFILGSTKEDGFSLERPLMEMGLDSADLLELNEQISYKYQLPLKPTFFFKHNTAERIITYLQEHVDDVALERTAKTQETVIPKQSVQNNYNDLDEAEVIVHDSAIQQNGIAIVGVACRLPGGIVNKHQFWELLINGNDAIGKMPPKRWNWPPDIDPSNLHKGIDTGGFLDDIAHFDASFFRISPKEAEIMDPQQRILLEMSWGCLEDAGYNAKVLSGSKTGVFIGASGSDYNRLLDKNIQEVEAHFGIGVSMAALANRISYFYDFNGPSIQIDTACSSSLVAVHEAIKSLNQGECEQALVGGIHIICYPSNTIAYYKAGMLSKEGKCKTFDKEANGYVRGEGAVMILLKPVEQAIRDQDSIYAVIKGTVINHGGQAGGLTVPNPEKQADLVSEALKTAKIEPETVGYIELHGTGTSLGDPIEFSGLKEAFAQLSKTKEEHYSQPYCGLGSVKTNIGHLEAAAGLAGLLKVILSMRHQTLPASLHFKELNPHIDFSNTPFYMVNKNRPWTLSNSQTIRRAGVSSFGSGGANAHVVLEEAPIVNRQGNRKLSSYIIALSAKSEEALQQRERDLALWLEQEGKQHDLTDISATLLLGREHFEFRSAFVIKDVQDLQEKLKEILLNGHVDGYFKENRFQKRDQTEPLFEQVGHMILKELSEGMEWGVAEYRNKLRTLAELFVKGYELDWKNIFVADNISRISLPTYPFAKEHYWVPELVVTNPTKSSPSTKEIEESFDEKYVVPRAMCLLKKQWEPSECHSAKVVERSIVILKTEDTEELANCLAQYFSGSIAVNFDDLLSQSPLSGKEWIECDGIIDLVGCGFDKNESLDWIPWVQQWIEYGHNQSLMLCVTKGLESYFHSSVNLSGASRAGLYRMLQSEYGHLQSRHMDVERTSDDHELAKQIVSEFLIDSEDVEVCYRNGKRYRAYLQEYQVAEQEGQKIAFPEEHVLWITGGTRGLGYLCAQHFVTNYGVKRVVLTGRETIPPRDQWDLYIRQNHPIVQKIRNVQALEAQGVQVRVLSVSLTDEHAVQQSLQEIKRTLGPIGGVIHCAGIDNTDNPAFIRKSIDSIQRVADPKVRGLDILYQCVRNEPLQYFVLFSSVSAIIPTLASGQSDYAAANAYMDYFAEANYHTCPIVSIQWPNWKETGMGEVKNKAYQQTGLLSHTNAEGLKFLDYILSKKMGPVVLPAVVEPNLWKPHQLMLRRSQEANSLIARTQRLETVDTNSASQSDTLMGATRTWLISLFSKELKMDPSKLETETPFQEFGVDSIFLAQILRSINQYIKADLDPSLLYEFSTIELLSAWLIETYPTVLSTVLPNVQDSLSVLSDRNTESLSLEKESLRRADITKGNLSDIAIIGLSCRFPGADNIEEYWNMLSEGKSMVRAVPQERWGYLSGFYAGMLDSIRCFDPKFFLLSEEDVKAMDPQALLLLEESLKLWYHAGYTHQEMKGKSVGVYLGARSQHKPEEFSIRQAQNPILAFGQNYLAANISQFFDLRGPSLVLDTACSSALVVMHMAMQALSSGEVESALVGGVNVLNTDETHRILQQRGILNPESSFHAFDQRANGNVLGEGVGMVLLKTVKQAVEDGDQIYAVIKASAINNDGRTAGPATPNLQALKEVMQTALTKSAKKAEEISYIEANASGSQVTDLLELKAIQSTYRSHTIAPLGLGSIKPNIGHPLCAEGIASLLKVVLMLQHRKFVPFLSGEQPPKYFDIESSPFYFCRNGREWTNPSLIAAINCFADGGTNAHVILEAWDDLSSRVIKRHPIAPPKLDRCEIVPLTEKTQSLIPVNESKVVVVKKTLDINDPVLQHHKVYGQSLLPGLAYIDLLYQIFAQNGYKYYNLELRKLTIYNPLTVGEDYNVVLSIQCSERSDGQWQLRVEGQEEHNGSLVADKKLYVTAEMHQIEPAVFDETLDVETIQKSANKIYSLEELYARSRRQELAHTGFIKAEGRVFDLDSATIVDISLGHEAMPSAGDSLFHPTLIDGSAVGSKLFPTLVDGEPQLFLPLYYESFRASSLLQRHCYTRIQNSSVQQKKELLSLTMEFFDSTGKKVGELKQFINKLVRDAGLIDPARQKTALPSIEDEASSVPPFVAQSITSSVSVDDNRVSSTEFESFLRQLIAEQLKKTIEQIDTQTGYYEMGLNSQKLLEVVTALEHKIDDSLSPTLLFEYTTIAELAAYLTEHYQSQEIEQISDSSSILRDSSTAENTSNFKFEPEDYSSEKSSLISSSAKEDIAIIGMSGRYPGAKNLQEFWLNLKAGKDCVSEVPKSRWDWHQFDGLQSPSDKNMSKWGGFLDDPDCFDPQFFRISPREAEIMDPQERLFLETCWETIEDAGYTPQTLVRTKGKNTRRQVGVFVGVMHKDYAFIGAEALSSEQVFPLSLNYAQIANRVSYFCDFHGPSMAVDTVCSSSLTALHMALESIRHGECEVALAGGVNLSLHPHKYLSYGMMDLHSSDGHCRTFGKGGDGYVSGEGIGAVLLKPLTKAIQDGDHIYAVIKGSSINHVGTVSGITVPSPVAQADMIATCLEKTGIHPRTISYVEAHGTGTSLGDPIELQGLEKAYRQYTHDKQYCAIGSVKSNIGHAESAAGISGLHKVVLNLYHKTLVPSLHSEELNPYINFEKSPFYVQRLTEDWKQPVIMENDQEVRYPRRAALSSFGATGSNAHVILEEYIPTEANVSQGAEQTKSTLFMIPLSAKNKERLHVYAENLLTFLKRQQSSDGNAEQGASNDQTKRRENLELRIRRILSSLIHVEEEAIELEEDWNEYGVDAVQFMRIEEEIQKECKVEINIKEPDQPCSIVSVAAKLLIHYEEGKDGQESALSPCGVNLADLAYTLQVGRQAMEERMLFIVKDVQDLITKLEDFIDNKNLNKHCYQGNVKQNKEIIKFFAVDEDSKELLHKWILKGKLEKLAELWTTGLEMDWDLLYGDRKPRRISLPTYPFAKERYWITKNESNTRTVLQGMGINSSSFERQVKYVQKSWRKSEAIGFNESNGLMLIYHNSSTRALAECIAQQYGNSILLQKGQLSNVWQEQMMECDVWVNVAEIEEFETSLESIPYLQRLIENSRSLSGLKLIHITKGLESFQNDNVNVFGAASAGLYRMLQNEYSSLNSRHVDLDPKDEDLTRQAEVILREIQTQTKINEVCYRNDVRYESILVDFDLDRIRTESKTLTFNDDHVLLVTGGTRGLGMLCARHMVTKYGVKQLVLTGQEKIPDRSKWLQLDQFSASVQEKIKAIESIEKQGVTVRVLSVPLNDADAVRSEISAIESSMGRITGVIHAAGLADFINPAFIRKDQESIARVLSPKVTGTENLLRCLNPDHIAFVLLFSSVASAIPSLGAGQSDYAMANAFMDYFSESTASSKVPIVSIQWPSWKETGLGEIKSQAYLNTGIKSITDAEGLRILDEILGGINARIVMPVVVNGRDWSSGHLLNNVPRYNAKDKPSKGMQKQSAAVGQQAGIGAIERALSFLQPIFESELKLNPNQLDKDTLFADYGIDSILMAQILQKINRALNIRIDPSILLEYSTLDAFAIWFSERYLEQLSSYGNEEDNTWNGQEEPTVLEAKAIKYMEESPTPTPQCMSEKEIYPSMSEDIAVVGMACRFPEAESLEAYWDLISEGRCAIKQVPETRWNMKSNYYAGLVDDIYSIDPQFFNLPADDASVMDPQAIVLLEESLKAVYHAGYSQQDINGANIGVYIGARTIGEIDKSAMENARNPIRVMGQNYLAANISQFFNFRGPSVVLDTACSSSLVAMQVAIDALKGGSLDAALVGGVTLLTSSYAHELFARRNLLQKNGEFHILDRRASGVVLGEGCGVVLLKTLSQAKRDGDIVYAVVKGIAINNDGRTVGPATPNINAQKEVMKTALQKSGCTPNQIEYLEVNGSGSEVTDLLEIKAVESVYREQTSNALYLGSVKPNIGHPLCAKGIASFIKVALMLKKQSLVPFLSGIEPLEHYSLQEANFKLSNKKIAHALKFASINCFADGGTNAHVILGHHDDGQYSPIRRPLSLPVMKRLDLKTLSPLHIEDEVFAKGTVVLDHGFTKSLSWNDKLSVNHPIIQNHVVFEENVLPGLAWIDLLYQWCLEADLPYGLLELKNLTIYRPLIVSESHPVKLVINAKLEENGCWVIQITGIGQAKVDGTEAAVLYVSAEMHRSEPSSFTEVVDISQIPVLAREIVDLGEIYSDYTQNSLVHTGVMKGQGAVLIGDNENWIHVSINESDRDINERYLFHPAVLDASVVGATRAVLGKLADDQLYLPLYYESFNASELFGRECYTRINHFGTTVTQDLVTITLEYFSSDGRKIGELKNLKIKAVRNERFLKKTQNNTPKSLPAQHKQVPNVTLEALLKSMIASYVGVNEKEVGEHKGYYELGLDSIMLLQAVKHLSSAIGVKLSPTIFFEHSTISMLSGYLWRQYPAEIDRLLNKESALQTMESTKSSTEVESLISNKPKSSTTEDISEIKCSSASVNSLGIKDVAVIGMAGRFPKSANLEEFWGNLCNGVDCITEIPHTRWDNNYFDGITSPSGKPMSKWGGFISDVECFDAGFFGITPEEATQMDPQERHFLEVCWEGIENAGYTPDNLVASSGEHNRRMVGVFVGAMHQDYAMLQSEESRDTKDIPLSFNASLIANRVSYFCNFHGPSIAIDTVCTSSLTAIHLALESIYRGESQVAIAGGVNLSIHPSKYQSYGMLDMHSSDGRCHSFGAGGDGYVSSEGVGVVILKPLDQALMDKDAIYAVIKSSAVNHVGKSSGMHVPSPVAQASVITDCLDKSGIDPETISYMEAHATGTLIGDSIEVDAMTMAFRKYTQKNGFCALGSVKSNIGHAESAAGISGMTSAILQLHHKKILHPLPSKEINPYLNLESSPFYLSSQVMDWSDDKILKGDVRRAAVHSIGATGSNAHIILEEAPDVDARLVDETQGVLIPVSAKNREALTEYIRKLVGFIEANKNIPLSRFAFTMQTGRIACRERFITLVTSLEELYSRFHEFLNGQQKIENSWYESVDETYEDQGLCNNDEELEQMISMRMDKDRLKKVAELWSKGHSIDWKTMYKEVPGRAHLPTYPFSKEKYWITSRSTVNHPESKNLSKSEPRSTMHVTFIRANDTGRIEHNHDNHVALSRSEKALLFCRTLVADVMNKPVEAIKKDDGFFAMGLTSAAIVSMALEIADKIDPTIFPSRLFHYKTVSELSEFLERHYSTALDNLIAVQKTKASSKPSPTMFTNNKYDDLNKENVDRKLLNALSELEKGSIDIDVVLKLID